MKNTLLQFKKTFLLAVLLLVSITKGISQVDYTIGTGTTGNINTGYPCPLQDYYEGSRMQFLYLASDLQAAGMTAGYITGLKYNVAALNATGIIEQMTMQITGTTVSSLSTSSWESISNVVYGPINYQPVTGANDFIFTTPYLWNGTDNILVEVCGGDPANGTYISYTANPTINQTTVGYNANHTYRADNGGNLCGSATTTQTGTATIRPNIIFTWMAATACSGTPVAGTAGTNVTTAVCPGAPVQLQLTGFTSASGLTFQWEESANLAGPYTPVLGATTAFANITAPTTSTYYQCAVSCGSFTDYSTPVQVVVNSLFPGGSYTINNALPTGGSNFASFTDAVTAIACGITGAVTFNVDPASVPYNEQITIPQVGGASAINTISFNGNGTTITFNSTNANAPYTFGLNGADYINVDNLNMEGTNATNALVCHLWNNADNNSFSNCTFTAPANGTSATHVPFSISGVATAALTTGPSGNNNIVTNCTMNNGYYNTVFYGNSGGINTGNQLINCNLKDFYYYGAMCYYQNGMVISGNTVERPTRTNPQTFYGIYVLTGSVGTLVEKNRIRNPFGGSPGNTNTVYGVYNSIDGTVGNENKFINNLISDMNGNGPIYGMYLIGADNVQAYHNTISLDDAASAATGVTYAIYNTGTIGNINIKNNIITITRGGTGTKYCLYYTGNLQQSNNNVLHINAPAGLNYTGYNGTASYATLANWQTASGSIYDGASFNNNPVYASPATGDFTPTDASLDGVGANLGITTDIIGNLRGPTPDPGAFEFTSAPCAGQPVAGTASGPIAICPGTNVNLSLSGYTTGAGITFQWEVFDLVNLIWVPIAGANSASYAVVGQTVPSDYRVIITCTTSSLSDISNTVTVGMNNFMDCYCTSIPTGTIDEEIYSVTVNGSSTPAAYAGTNGCSTPAPGPGSILNRYSNFKTIAPIASVAQGSTVNFTVTENECNGTPFYAFGTGIWIDYNHNGLFTDPGEEIFKETATLAGPRNIINSFVVPSSALLGPTVMRVIVAEGYAGATLTPCLAFGYGETEDWIIDIFANVPCAGQPTAGTASGPTGVCPGGIVNLSLSGYTNASGITIQWEVFDPVNLSWGPAPGVSTNPGYTSSPLTAPADFRAVVTCANSSLSDISNTVSIGMNPFLNCYCIPTTTNGCGSGDHVINLTFAGINNTSGTCISGQSYSNYQATVTPASALQGQTLPVSAIVANGGPEYAGVWIDYNQSGTFDASEYTSLGTGVLTAGNWLFNASITIPVTALPGTTGLRIRSSYNTTIAAGSACSNTYSYGETEDYLINIIALAPCSAMPSAGTASGPSNAFCAGANPTANLTLTGYTAGTGIALQWEYYDVALASWLPVTNGGTSASYTTVPLTATTDYHCVVTCTPTLQSAVSNMVTVTVNNPTAIPYPGGRCDAGTVTLAATPVPSTATLKWYNVATGGTSLGTGSIFTTPSLSSSATYYVGATTGAGSGAVPELIYYKFDVPGTTVLNEASLPVSASGTVQGTASIGGVGEFGTALLGSGAATATNSVNANWPLNLSGPWTISMWFSGVTNALTSNYMFGGAGGSTFRALTGSGVVAGAGNLEIRATGMTDVFLNGIFDATGSPVVAHYVYDPTIPAIKGYINGVLVTTVAQSATMVLTGTDFTVGGQAASNGLNAGGKMDEFRLYNRALDAAEIAATWNAALGGCEGTRVPVPATITGTSSGTGLSSGGTTIVKNQANGTTENYFDACNDKVATVVDAPGGNVLGSTFAIALTTPSLLTYNGAPYVKRMYDITPASNGPATVTLFALQSEFNEYNAYVTANSLPLPLLPAFPTDPNKANIVLTQYHGLYSAGTTGPLNSYDAANDEFIPAVNVTANWNAAGYWEITFPVTGFSGFAIHTGNGPLMIGLKDIKATNVGTRNRVDWNTATESAGDYFIVERSADGRNFTALGNVNAKGQASSYSYWDENPVTGINYYRLKLMDAANHGNYSKVVTATVKDANAFSVDAYPNPVSENLTIKVYGQQGNNAVVTISDATGKIVRMVEMKNAQTTISMIGLSSGMYLVKYSDNIHTQTLKVNKQ